MVISTITTMTGAQWQPTAPAGLTVAVFALEAQSWEVRKLAAGISLLARIAAPQHPTRNTPKQLLQQSAPHPARKSMLLACCDGAAGAASEAVGVSKSYFQYQIQAPSLPSANGVEWRLRNFSCWMRADISNAKEATD